MGLFVQPPGHNNPTKNGFLDLIWPPDHHHTHPIIITSFRNNVGKFQTQVHQNFDVTVTSDWLSRRHVQLSATNSPKDDAPQTRRSHCQNTAHAPPRHLLSSKKRNHFFFFKQPGINLGSVKRPFWGNSVEAQVHALLGLERGLHGPLSPAADVVFVAFRQHKETSSIFRAVERKAPPAWTLPARLSLPTAV